MGAAGLVGVGFGVGVAVAVGVGVGLGVGGVATTSGDGTDAGELATSALAAARSAALSGGLTGLRIAEVAAPEIVVAELTAGVDPADVGWLLVHAARAATERTPTTQLAGVGLVVRSRLAIDPG